MLVSRTIFLKIMLDMLDSACEPKLMTNIITQIISNAAGAVVLGLGACCIILIGLWIKDSWQDLVKLLVFLFYITSIILVAYIFLVGAMVVLF